MSLRNKGVGEVRNLRISSGVPLPASFALFLESLLNGRNEFFVLRFRAGAEAIDDPALAVNEKLVEVPTYRTGKIRIGPFVRQITVKRVLVLALDADLRKHGKGDIVLETTERLYFLVGSWLLP